MQCFNGLQLTNGSCVPCGQCINCRINKSRKWTARILAEMISAPPRSCWFFTLTLSDENIYRAPPEAIPSLQKGTFRRWLASYQRSHSAFRYYAVGEYGDLSLRPHYHLAMFHQPASVMWHFYEAWQARWGNALYSEMGEKRAAYLAQYTTKKLTSPDDDRLRDGGELNGCEPEFRTSTRHPPLGFHMCRKVIAGYCTVQGQAILAERGDVGRTFRMHDKLWPLDQYMLRTIRKALGIPLTHTGRIDANPNYLEYNAAQEADQCLDATLYSEQRYAAKKKAHRANRATV